MYSVQCTYDHSMANHIMYGIGYWGGMMYSMQCTYDNRMATYNVHGVGEVLGRYDV